MIHMKIATMEPESEPATVKNGKVKRSLAVKAQKFIEKATIASGIKRDLIQSALFRNLERAGVRIGIATVERLLKDPKTLVDGYLHHVAVEEAEKTGNFERTLKQMLQNSAKIYAKEAFVEIKAKFPQSRDFRALNMVGRLCAENKGRPLTFVKLPEGVQPFQAGTDPSIGMRRLVDGSLVLKDGEVVAWKMGIVIGPVDAKELNLEYTKVWGTGLAEDKELVVVKAPGKPQMTLEFD